MTLLQTEMKALTEKQKTEAFFDAGSDAAAAAAAKPRSSVDEETILTLLTENKAMEVRAKDAEARAMLLEGNVASLQSMLTQLEVGKLSHPEEDHDDRDDEHAMHVHNLQQQLLLASADTKDVEDRYQQLEMQLVNCPNNYSSPSHLPLISLSSPPSTSSHSTLSSPLHSLLNLISSLSSPSLNLL